MSKFLTKIIYKWLDNALHFHLKFNIFFPLIGVLLSMLLLYGGTLQ